MQVAIRQAISADEAKVTALWRSCNLVTSYNDPGLDFNFALSSPASTVLVAQQSPPSGGRGEGEPDIAGSVMVGHDGHRGWMYYVASSPAARGVGVGRKLVEAAEDWLRERGVRKCQLLVRKTNETVVSFYEGLGFETAPVVTMGKWLDGAGSVRRNRHPAVTALSIVWIIKHTRTDRSSSVRRGSCHQILKQRRAEKKKGRWMDSMCYGWIAYLSHSQLLSTRWSFRVLWCDMESGRRNVVGRVVMVISGERPYPSSDLYKDCRRNLVGPPLSQQA
ncbi:hypothetical protein U1Q18_052335 [Sarracenia purpurea var. burkii]